MYKDIHVAMAFLGYFVKDHNGPKPPGTEMGRNLHFPKPPYPFLGHKDEKLQNSSSPSIETALSWQHDIAVSRRRKSLCFSLQIMILAFHVKLYLFLDTFYYVCKNLKLDRNNIFVSKDLII